MVRKISKPLSCVKKEALSGNLLWHSYSKVRVLVVAINCCGPVAPLVRSNGRLMLGYHTVLNLPHKGPGRRVHSVALIPNVPQSQKCSNYRAPRAGYEGWGVASRAPRASPKGALPIEHLELFLKVSHLEHLGLVPVLKKGLKN